LFPKDKPSLHGHIRGAAKFTKEKKACAYTSAAPLICPCKEGLSFGNNDTYVLPFDKLSYLFKQKNSLIYSLKTQKCDGKKT
jgi:hypothetical protein